MTLRYREYLTTSALLLALSAPVYAQDSAPQTSNVPQAADTGIEDIVVTAQRRAENLQKVPISITAITARALERSGTTGVNSIAQVTPGLNFTAPAGQLTPFLRGVGTAAAAVGNSASVATYVDGVYIPGMASTQFEFNNIERIEVLKGPQGTLFGRNSTGGIINVITRDPTFDTQVRLRAGYGNYDTVEGSIYASTGITDDVAMDVSGFYRNQGKGWAYNFATQDDVAKQRDFLLRSKLLFTPSSETRIVLSADYAYTNPAAASLNIPYQDALTVVGIPVPGNGFWDVNQNFYRRGVAKQGGGSVTVEQGMGAVKLRSITAYRKQYGNNIIDLDGSQVPALAIDITERSKQFTQELQLLSNTTGPFQWIVGGFYLSGTAKTDPFRNPGFALFATQQVESGSAFAQGTYEVATGTRLTAGLRYTNDTYTFNDYRQSNATGAITLDPQRETSQGKLTWRLALDHQFNPDVLGYISYNRGFRAGTFNLTDASVAALRPEVIDALEAGLKTDLLDRRLRMNLAVYHYDFKDIQIARADGNSQQTLNASSAKIWGIDADVNIAITEQLTLNLGGAYVHGRYDSFLNAPISTRNPRGGNTIVTGDATGNTIIRTPTFTGNAGVNYAIPSSVGKFNISANYYYNGGWYSDPDNRIKTPSYNLVSGSIGWESNDERYEAHLWAKNLTNAKYYNHVQSIGPGDVAIQAAPRTYGVTLGVNF